MKMVNMIGMNLLGLTLLSPVVCLWAQTSENLAPKFALAIEEEQLSAQAGYQPADHELIVKYTNTSEKVQRDACAVIPDAYNLVVLRDGVAVEKRKSKKEAENNSEDGSTGTRIEVTQMGPNCHSDNKGLNPGQSVTFPLWVSSDYDMTVPGTYDITVTRETDRWNPEKSVTVESNTLTIVVPEPGADSSK